MPDTKKHLKENGLVIFAGAGCSIPPPASLPSWLDLNDVILETLWDRLAPYNLPNKFRGKIINEIKTRREQSKFTPDYQAQIMVERVGMKYFELLTAVDSDEYNAFHYYTAQAVMAGGVKAIVTTNFDRNFERAFTEAGIAYRSYIDEQDFNAFDQRLPVEIPIIKIHGCCSSPESMVDTRKQRLKGRAKSLEIALAALFRKHYVLFAGFSGADLDDNENYLGLKEAATFARGFTFLHRPNDQVRESVKKLINVYGATKACDIVGDAATFLEELLLSSFVQFAPFVHCKEKTLLWTERLREKIEGFKPMDAANMMFALAESYGDEPAVRYLYDRLWKERASLDYEEEESLGRFLLNHGRSYVFNFQNKVERARAVGVPIIQVPIGPVPEGREGYFKDPAKINLFHEHNTSPETAGLIGLMQTYNANPILFLDFPKTLFEQLRRQPTPTELADIIYYYSFYALVYGDANVVVYLTHAISEMEKDFDEPRLSQLLSRRAMIIYRSANSDIQTFALEDAKRARELAEKYHEPHLLSLSALALAIGARKRNDFLTAFQYIQEAEINYSQLKRIPQYIETIVEYLKVIMLGFQDESTDKEKLLRLADYIRKNVNSYVVERINVFEPEFCYLMGMIMERYTDAPREMVLTWFADAVSLSFQFKQEANNAYFRETCVQLGIIDDVDNMIAAALSGQAEGNKC